MADVLTPEQRHKCMSKIQGRDTKPEIRVRKWLHNQGYRFRLQRNDLPGKPDIVLPKYNLVIFINGCYWHRHSGCKYTTTPKSNSDFWEKKFAENIIRDKANIKQLEQLGWNVIVIWECEVKSESFTNHLQEYFKNYNKMK